MPIPLVTRILIADDFALVREGLKKVLDDKPDLQVVAEAADGAEAVDTALREEVDLAVLDISMPRMTGIQAAAELQRRKLGVTREPAYGSGVDAAHLLLVDHLERVSVGRAALLLHLHDQ